MSTAVNVAATRRRLAVIASLEEASPEAAHLGEDRLVHDLMRAASEGADIGEQARLVAAYLVEPCRKRWYS